MKLFSSKLKASAIYEGKDMSLGYRVGQVYQLTIWSDGGFIWIKSIGHPPCPYTPLAFQKIWRFI